MGGEVGAADRKGDRRLPVRLIHGVKQVRGFGFVPCFEDALFGAAVLLPVKTAVAAAIESVFQLHVHLRCKEIPRAELIALPGNGGVDANSGALFVLLALHDERLTVWLQR